MRPKNYARLRRRLCHPPLPSPSSSDPAATNALKKRCEDAEEKLKLAKANAATLELRVKELEESAMSSPKPSSIPSSKSLSASKGSDRNENILEPINGGNVLSGGEQSASTRERELLKQLTNERQARAMYQRDSRDKQKQIDEYRKQLSSFAGSTSFRGGGGAPSAFPGGLRRAPPPSSSKRTLLGNTNASAAASFQQQQQQQQQRLPSTSYSAMQTQSSGGHQTTDVPTSYNNSTNKRGGTGSLLFTAISDAHKIRLYSPREAKVLSTAHQRTDGRGGGRGGVSLDDPRNPFARGGAKVVSTPSPSPSPWKANLAGLPRLSNTNEKKVVEAPSSSSRAKRTSSHGWSRTKTIGR